MGFDPLAVFGGYLYAIGVGQLVVPRVLDVMPQSRQVQERAATADAGGNPETWHRAAFGVTEAAAISTGVMLGYIEVIPIWLVFKGVAAWGGWKEEAGTFNRFAVGTVMAIAFGAAGGALTLALPRGDAWAIGLVLGPLLLAGLVWSLYRGPAWWGKALRDR